MQHQTTTKQSGREAEMPREDEAPTSLMDLPPELIALVALSLPLRSLESLASVCSAAHTGLPDDLWQRPLAVWRCEAMASQAMAWAACLAAPGHASDIASELAAVGVSGAPAREQVHRLRSLVCDLCFAQAAIGAYCHLSRRGICFDCHRSNEVRRAVGYASSISPQPPHHCL